MISRRVARGSASRPRRAVQVELVDTADGEHFPLHPRRLHFTDLCRGPTCRLEAESGVQLTVSQAPTFVATSTTSRSDADYGTAFYEQADLDEYVERLEQALVARPPRLGRILDFSPLRPLSGLPVLHPKGMVIWNELEDLRPPRE